MGLLDWLGFTTVGKTLELGDPAPDAASRDERGNPVRLADFYGEGYTLVYFYPKADTPGCTMQACNLRDGFDDLKAREVRIVGVSADGPESQLQFKEKYHLPFTLLADKERAVLQAFGVPTLLGMANRQSFLIKGGKVVWRDLKASTRWQAQDVMKAIEGLEQSA
jgi:peroxiredoxin Q/BCP